MSNLDRKWILHDECPEGVRNKLGRWRDETVLQQLFWNRNINNEADAMKFVLHQISHDTDPYLLIDMTKAVERIFDAIDNKELIVIYGDYDVDGVTATTVLKEGLDMYGADSLTFIPDRNREGYGIHSHVIKQFVEQGVKLIVSVDCGVTAIDEVDFANKSGIDTIITDHHQISGDMPQAYAIINPNRSDCNYPDKNLVGVGLAYKLVEALVIKRTPYKNNVELDDLLQLVALGTVADLGVLRGENRVMVNNGLKNINKKPRLGIKTLLESAYKKGDVSTDTIGFQLGPRINAAGRMGDPSVALNLMISDNESEAVTISQVLEKYNRDRQKITREMTKQAVDLCKFDTGKQEPYVLLIESPGFHKGLVGLIASRLCEYYYRPTIIGHRVDGFITASARSIKEFNIIESLKQCSHLFERYGGHPLAAGLTINESKWTSFVSLFEEIAKKQLEGLDLRPVLNIDCEVNGLDLTSRLTKQLEFFEPIGNGNNRPLFVWYGANVVTKKQVGQDKSHIKLMLDDGAGVILDAIGFGLGYKIDNLGSTIDLVFSLEINEWNGKKSRQLNLQDLRPHGV